jgi:hypothetical protein
LTVLSVMDVRRLKEMGVALCSDVRNYTNFLSKIIEDLRINAGMILKWISEIGYHGRDKSAFM